MAEIIPLQTVPNQALITPVGNQSCGLVIYQKSTGLFMDVFVNDAPIILGVLCENANRIVRDLYLGFVGDFAFFDTQAPAGTRGDDPDYTGLGSRFLLVYIEASELPAGVG